MLHPPHQHLGYIFGYVNFSLYTLKLKLIPEAAASQLSLCDLQHPPALSPGLLSLIFPSASSEDSPSQRNTGSKIGKLYLWPYPASLAKGLSPQCTAPKAALSKKKLINILIFY